MINTGDADKMSIESNIRHILSEIDDIAKKAGRNPKDIKLVAVSKTKPFEMLKEAFDCGMTEFGENKPQEIAEKFPLFEGADVNFHMIGHLQKNKVKMIIDKVCLIHSVDSIELAEEINKRAALIDKVQDILIQVNISGEESKSGVSPDELFELCNKISLLKKVKINGLMTISVKDYTYEENKQLFLKLASLAKEVDSKNIENVSMKELSMGMTHDYKAAVETGATIIRVGTAIFGERNYSNL